MIHKHDHDSPIEKVIELEENIVRRLSNSRKNALERYPFLFLILTTVGTILTLSGMQKLLEKVDWLIGNPPLMLLLGLITLFMTGALYKKLG